MSSAVAELDGYLQSMLSLKPPGVSGSKIGSITQLCTANIQVRPDRNLFFGTFSFQSC
jgi:protein NRD1